MTKNKKGSEVVRTLKSIFARHGIPEKIRSDNGPPFDSGEYARFAKTGDLKSPQVAQNFPDGMEKQSGLYRLQNQF